jgi:putative ABC transport system permease protein
MPIADLRHAWRSLGRTPAFTVTAIFTLVIGVAATVAIFTVVNRVLLNPLPYGNPERLVGAWHDMPPLSLKHVEQAASTYFAYQRNAKSIDGIAVYQEGAVNVSYPGADGEPQRLDAAFVSANLVSVLQVPPVLGRSFTEAEDRPKGPDVVIISENVWRTRFNADQSVIGKTLDVQGKMRQIVGVMPERFRFPARNTQIWLPLALDANDPYPGGFSYSSVARLKPGVSVEAAQRDFAAVLSRLPELFPTFAPGITTQMLLAQAKPQPLLVPMRKDVTADIAGTLWMVFAAAGLVLLVACANVANLILVRADSRQRELAVREALGAGRGRVLGHFLSESAVLTVAAGVLGVIVAYVAVRTLVSAGFAELPRISEIALGGTEVLFAIGVSALIALVCSVIPALRIGRVQLANALREGGRAGTAGRARHRVRGALVAAQIALALVVLAGSGLLLRTFQRLHAIKPGFDPENVMTLWVSAPRARYTSDTTLVRFYSQVTARIAELPGVRSVGITSRLPLMLSGMNKNPFYPENDATWANKVPPLQVFTTVDGGYFRTMGIPLIAGTTFGNLETQRGEQAIISRLTAQQFFKDSTGAAALGKRFSQLPGGPLYTIIGVVGDVRDTALTAPASQTVYFPQALPHDTLLGQTRSTMALVVRTSGEPAAIVPAVRRALREVDATLPTFQVRAMSAVVGASMARLSFVIIVLGSAAVVALLLGAVGLYGVMAYLVTLRTRELGVRIALGAQPRAVAAMMTRQGLVLTAVGVAVGLSLFALVARFLRAFLYGVAPSDPVTLLAASLMLVAIASLASWIPARRASRVDPVEALRAE